MIVNFYYFSFYIKKTIIISSWTNKDVKQRSEIIINNCVRLSWKSCYFWSDFVVVQFFLRKFYTISRQLFCQTFSFCSEKRKWSIAVVEKSIPGTIILIFIFCFVWFYKNIKQKIPLLPSVDLIKLSFSVFTVLIDIVVLSAHW